MQKPTVLEDEELMRHPMLLTLFSENVLTELRTQLSTANYLSAPVVGTGQPDHVFRSNEVLWDAVLTERLYPSTTIKLDDFYIFEWFPRSPGLYHTPDGRHSRLIALDYTIPYNLSSEVKNIDDANRLAKGNFLPDHMRIFNPHGKWRMIEGGIGSIRLQDKNIDVGKVYFMAASSTLIAHEGFPIALPEHIYEKLISSIREKGVVRCNLVGKLRFVPSDLNSLYSGYTRVPQLYLLVDSYSVSKNQALNDDPEVSVAVMFRTTGESENNYFSSYVTFYPGQRGSLESRVEWLEDTYVKSMYNGEIITDFDEHSHRFENAEFSLKKVLNKDVTMDDAENFIQHIHVSGNACMAIDALSQIYIDKVDSMIHKKEISIGDNNVIHEKIVLADSIERSFVTMSDSNTNAEVQRLLTELLSKVNELNEITPAERAEHARSMMIDIDSLAKETANETPRREWYELSLKGLKEAAVALGETAKPVLKIVEKLVAILL